MKTLLLTALIASLTACAGHTNRPLPDSLAGFTPNTPIACQFDKELSDGKTSQHSDWYFWRQGQRTETRDEASQQGEIWEKNAAGQFFYTRLFYNEKVALDFVPGDLAATGSTPSWQMLSSLLDPSHLGKELALTGKENVNRIAVEHYRGTEKGIETEVDWLPDTQLPARLSKKLPEGTVTLSLSQCGEQAIKAKPISKPELDNLRHLDFTDLGDMEEDPLVQHLEKLMGGHHHEH